MIGLRMQMIQKNLKEALRLLEMERDMNGSMSIKEALTHVLTADMWISRQVVHQEAKSDGKNEQS